MVVVCDSSPLIAFARLDRLDLLETLFRDVIVPEAVFREISPVGKPLAPTLSDWCRTRLRAAARADLVARYLAQLGAGESEAFALYQEILADRVLLDDKKARRIADVEGIRYVGTLGTLLEAKRRGFVREVKPLLMGLRTAGIWISDEVFGETLRTAGEA